MAITVQRIMEVASEYIDKRYDELLEASSESVFKHVFNKPKGMDFEDVAPIIFLEGATKGIYLLCSVIEQVLEQLNDEERLRRMPKGEMYDC